MIAMPTQLSEVERAAEEAERLYFAHFRKEEFVQHFDWATKNWHEVLKPEIDKALQAIRERSKSRNF